MISLTSGEPVEVTGSRPSLPARNVPRASPPIVVAGLPVEAPVAPSVIVPPVVVGNKKTLSFFGPIRKYVSGSRCRTIASGYDLDLTYITKRIIAMGFPSKGIASLVRNPRDQVKSFLNEFHTNKYLVFNLCAEENCLYKSSEFSHANAPDGHVCIPILDHAVPNLYQMIQFVQSAVCWLNSDFENVIVVHCLAGKGRTGLMISALLLYMQICPTAAECIEFFNTQRGGSGVQIPSQIRIVKYFEEMMTLCENSIPIAIAAISVAKTRWELLSIELGPTRAILSSVFVRPRSSKSDLKLDLPLTHDCRQSTELVQMVHIPFTHNNQITFSQDAYFSIKLKKSKSIKQTVKFWFCAEMTQTMLNHRISSNGHSTLFLAPEELDAPPNADAVLGYRHSLTVAQKADGLPSERFYVKVNVRFTQVN